MFKLKKQGAVVLIIALALLSGCVETEKTNETIDDSPTGAVEMTSIADSQDPETLPDYPVKNNTKPGANSKVQVTGFPTVDATVLPFSTPPTPLPTQFPINTPPLITPVTTVNFACTELNNVQRQIQVLQNDRLSKSQMLNQYESLKANATLNGDTQSATYYQTQIDEWTKMISSIDQQLVPLKARESVLAGQCYNV